MSGKITHTLATSTELAITQHFLVFFFILLIVILLMIISPVTFHTSGHRGHFKLLISQLAFPTVRISNPLLTR